MSIFETYSKRLKKRERAGQPDVYKYDELPEALRTQIVHIWRSTLGQNRHLWETIHDTLAREMGVFHLWGDHRHSSDAKCVQFVLSAPTLQALDIIELSFRFVEDIYQYVEYPWSAQQQPRDAIDELNHRFREHGVGYQFVEGEICGWIPNIFTRKWSNRSYPSLMLRVSTELKKSS
jgi:hypothetical protein